MHQVFLIRIWKVTSLIKLEAYMLREFVKRMCSLDCKDNYSLALGGASASCEGWKCPRLK